MKLPRRILVNRLAPLARAQHRRQVLAVLAPLGVQASQSAAAEAFELCDAAGRTGILSFSADGAIAVTLASGRTVTRWFDASGELIRLVDSGGLTLTVENDPSTGTREIRRGGFGAYRLRHEAGGWLDRIDYPDGTSVRYEAPDPMQLRVTGRAGEVRRWLFGPDGNVAEAVDANGHATRTRWTPDGDGRRCTVALPDGSRQEFRLDAGGALREWLVNGSRVATYRGQAGAWPAEARFYDGSFLRLQAAGGRIVRAENENGDVALAYDAAGRLVAEDQNGQVVRYERDATGLLTAIIRPDGRRIAFERDGDGRIADILDWLGERTRIAWAANGQVASVAHPNGVTTAVESNALGLVTRIRTTDRSGATVQALEYRHDAGDRIAWQSDGRVTRSYAYDGAGRLTGLRDSRGGVEAWTLDAMGNRLAGADGRRFAADPCNRISGAGEDAIRHDGLGRVVAARLQRGMARLHWNGRGQLLRVEMADGRVADYAYDAFGRRIRKGVDGRVTRYLWAGQMLLSEVTEGGGVVRRRDHLVLPDLFVPLAVWVDGRPLRLHTDHRCVPLAATDAAGHVAWAAEVEAFGAARVAGVTCPPRSGPPVM